MYVNSIKITLNLNTVETSSGTANITKSNPDGQTTTVTRISMTIQFRLKINIGTELNPFALSLRNAYNDYYQS